jgi:hypothetical protein
LNDSYPKPQLKFISGACQLLPAMDKQRENGALLIAAGIMAAIRLRGEPVKPSPKLNTTIADSVQLARMVLAQIR